MATVNLALTVELNNDLSEETLASLTSALIIELSKESSKALKKAIVEQGIHDGTTGWVNIKPKEESEAEKLEAKAALEALADTYEKRAETSNSTIHAILTGALDFDEPTDVHIEAGIAEGFKAAAAAAREAAAKI